MRNVVKGFEISHLAVPKPDAKGINKMYSRMHTPRMSKKLLRGSKKAKYPKMPKMPGHNPGID